MRPIGFRLYLIADAEAVVRAQRVADALAEIPMGCAAVQLRQKSFGGNALYQAARVLRRITERYHAPLLINDRLDVALAAGADGVHLPVNGIGVAEARRLAPTLLIGASTHSIEEARAAHEAGADFATFGPVYATPSKARMGEPVGLLALAEAARAVSLPLFALGGVDFERAAVCAAVCAGVACIRAVLHADDPGIAADRMWSACCLSAR